MNHNSEGLQPLDSKTVPRFAGVATFMRAQQQADATGLDIALVGVPFDLGSLNRNGARHGPAQMREMSRLIRKVHLATGIAPFKSCRVADIGDAPVNPLDLMGSVESIQSFFEGIHAAGALPLAAGGDHTITLPILRGLAKDGPVGMIQFDAHPDTHDVLQGYRINNATCFRRAIEEGIVDPRRYVMLGIRGTLFAEDDLDWARAQGVTIITIDDFYEMGVADTISTILGVLGAGPVYLTFDIDGLDPIYATGTASPEPDGLMMHDTLRILRSLSELELIGADITEVSPPLDPFGNTALTACHIMFEELTLLAAVAARRPARH